MDFKTFKDRLLVYGIEDKDSDLQVSFRCPFFEHRVIPKKKDVIVKKKREARISVQKPIFFVGSSSIGVCLFCRKETRSFEELLAELDAVRKRGGKPDPRLLPCFVCNKRIATVSVPVEGKYPGVPVESGLPEVCFICRETIIADAEAKKVLLPYYEKYF